MKIIRFTIEDSKNADKFVAMLEDAIDNLENIIDEIDSSDFNKLLVKAYGSFWSEIQNNLYIAKNKMETGIKELASINYEITE